MDHLNNESPSPPLKLRVVATLLLVALNVLVYAVTVSQRVSPSEPSPGDLVKWGANFGPATLGGQWWRLFTYQFVNAGWYHLLLNVVCLVCFGFVLERRVGAVSVLLLYIVSGVCGGILRLYWDPFFISTGASGSLFGIIGAVVAFIVRPSDAIPDDFRRDAGLVVYVFLGWNVVQAFTSTGVDNAAHFGGFVGGFVGGLILSRSLSAGIISRVGKNSAVAAVGLVTLGLFISFPPRVADTRELNSILSTQVAVIDKAATLLKSLQAEEITRSEYVNFMERDVLPQWSEVRRQVDSLLAADTSDEKLLQEVAGCFELREEAWRLLVRSIRDNSEALHREAISKWQAAEEATKRLKSKTGSLSGGG